MKKTTSFPALLEELAARPAESAQAYTGAKGRMSRAEAAALLSAVEARVSAKPDASFRLDASGFATLSASGRSWEAGRFATPTIAELRAALAKRARTASARVRPSIVHGAHPLTDVGTLQALAPEGSLFQVASQFNCLEAPGAEVVPVSDYLHDPTQGPRAAVSAFPGALLRHYFAPAADGSRFTQRTGHCLNLLADVFDNGVAEVRNGYLQLRNVHDKKALARALGERFEHLRVGVHDGIEVVFGHDWTGPVPVADQRIAQVLTSTIALGGYSRDDGSAEVRVARRQLLRGAYLGTLLAALSLDKRAVVLTLIGGGVFGNPVDEIWDAIHWAVAEAEPLAPAPLEVIVNAREAVSEDDVAKVRARQGSIVRFGR